MSLKNRLIGTIAMPGLSTLKGTFFLVVVLILAIFIGSGMEIDQTTMVWFVLKSLFLIVVSSVFIYCTLYCIRRGCMTWVDEQDVDTSVHGTPIFLKLKKHHGEVLYASERYIWGKPPDVVWFYPNVENGAIHFCRTLSFGYNSYTVSVPMEITVFVSEFDWQHVYDKQIAGRQPLHKGKPSLIDYIDRALGTPLMMNQAAMNIAAGRLIIGEMSAGDFLQELKKFTYLPEHGKLENFIGTNIQLGQPSIKLEMTESFRVDTPGEDK